MGVVATLTALILGLLVAAANTSFNATNQEVTSIGSVHGFKHNTDQPIRVFINIAPAGFEHFFAEAAEE